MHHHPDENIDRGDSLEEPGPHAGLGDVHYNPPLMKFKIEPEDF
jgi:hypothetical protein